MTSDPVQSNSQWPPLPDTCELYRPLIRPGDVIDKVSGKPAKEAFMRRPPHPNSGELRDTHGLSVSIKEYCSIEQIRERFNKVFSICALTAGHVREVKIQLPLDVIRDTEDHANITGLPSRDEVPLPPAQQILAENYASELVSRCVVVWAR